jgi:hypothetical protein
MTFLTYPRGAKIRVDNLHYDLTEDDLEVRSPSSSYNTAH